MMDYVGLNYFLKRFRCNLEQAPRHPRYHIDCVQLGFHIPTLPPPFLPAGTPASFNFVIWSIILCLVFCSRRFVFFLLSFHFPLEDGFPFLFEPSERAISFCWSRPTPHHPIFVRANCPFTFFSSSFVQTLPQENCWPQNFVVPLPALGKKGGAVTANSPCSCRLQGPQQPPCWRSISHCFEALLAQMNIFSSLVLLSLPCRRWLYMLLMNVQLFNGRAPCMSLIPGT